jgi:hypothetical protein
MATTKVINESPSPLESRQPVTANDTNKQASHVKRDIQKETRLDLRMTISLKNGGARNIGKKKFTPPIDIGEIKQILKSLDSNKDIPTLPEEENSQDS